jgi:hypothetical protein
MLADWERSPSPFDVRWDRQLAGLVRELEHLDAADINVGLNCRPSQLRADGWPKGGASLDDPVSLTFASKVGPLRFQCDRFFPWQANLRAIGLTLQRLRLVDEGGVARSGEQYTGWNALPPGRPMGPPTMPLQTAEKVMGEALGLSGADVCDGWAEHGAGWYRNLSRRHHPDSNPDADPAVFARLAEAKAVLEANHA